MKKILILGDSFAADWSVKFKDYKGWPNLLAEKYQVDNIAQAGVAEYKIYKQLLSITDLNVYDFIIISHTSPYRVHTRNHPIHCDDILHNHADLIYGDVEYHKNRWYNLFNKRLRAAYEFFKYHYDEEYFFTTYWLYRKEIDLILKKHNVLVIDNFNEKSDCLNFKYMIPTYSGRINHFNKEGNEIIYHKLIDYIENNKY